MYYIEGSDGKIAFYGEEGLFHCDEKYGVTIIIPKGIVQGKNFIEFGVTGLISDFKCEESFTLASPIVWAHTNFDIPEDKWIELRIPHYVKLTSENSLRLLIKGHGKDAVFKDQTNNKDVDLDVFKVIACARFRNHLCTICLGNPDDAYRYHAIAAYKYDANSNFILDICIMYASWCSQVL